MCEQHTCREPLLTTRPHLSLCVHDSAGCSGASLPRDGAPIWPVMQCDGLEPGGRCTAICSQPGPNGPPTVTCTANNTWSAIQGSCLSGWFGVWLVAPSTLCCIPRAASLFLHTVCIRVRDAWATWSVLLGLCARDMWVPWHAMALVMSHQ